MTADPGVPHIDPTVRDFSALCDLVDSYQMLFMRCSKGPEDDLRNGHSVDLESGEHLPGWIATILTPEPWWTLPTADWVARRVATFPSPLRQPDEQIWVLLADLVGRGPRHEPLVDNMHFVAWLRPEALLEAVDHYTTHFDVHP